MFYFFIDTPQGDQRYGGWGKIVPFIPDTCPAGVGHICPWFVGTIKSGNMKQLIVTRSELEQSRISHIGSPLDLSTEHLGDFCFNTNPAEPRIYFQFNTKPIIVKYTTDGSSFTVDSIFDFWIQYGDRGSCTKEFYI